VPRLTERFYRVDAESSRKKKGTGLGLAIVKHIVTRHRGLLTIKSQPGQGTRVEVFSRRVRCLPQRNGEILYSKDNYLRLSQNSRPTVIKPCARANRLPAV
jgi:hypothetical protein